VSNPPSARPLRADKEPTSLERIAAYFRAAGVKVFATAHTGLAFMQNFEIDRTERLVVNNGAAGMPNFSHEQHGVLTRISVDEEPPEKRLYGIRVGNLRCDALPVEYDHEQWQRRFLETWPPGSSGHSLYWNRIEHGPDFELHEAIRIERR